MTILRLLFGEERVKDVKDTVLKEPAWVCRERGVSGIYGADDMDLR